ncbi:MAG: energy transducer TonB [Dissulfurispiraceae bacterium]|jgi:periplasmic protein TonB
MGKPTENPVELLPIDAQLIEQSVPAATRSIKQEQPASVHQPKPLPMVRPQQAPVMPAPQADLTTNSAVTVPAAAAPVSAHAMLGEGKLSSNSGTLVGSYNGASGDNTYTSSGARAIVQPMPQIPDDLREGVFNVTALARFHIAVDGSVKVELAKPTPNPRLNRILLDSLRKWWFSPAIKNGKAVASTEEIVVKIQVK